MSFYYYLGDTIPQVIASLFPSILNMPFLYLFTERNFIIIVCTTLISYPLALYRDISNLAKASGLALISMSIIVISVAIEGPLVHPSIRGSKEASGLVSLEVFQVSSLCHLSFPFNYRYLLLL